MQLENIYGYKKVVRKAAGWKQAKKFFKNPQTLEPFDELNDYRVPTTSDIINFQREQLKNMVEDRKVQEIIDIINRDLKLDLSLQRELTNIEQNIKTMEDLFSFEPTGLSSLANKNKEITSIELQNFLDKNTNFINQLEAVYKELLNAQVNNISESARFYFTQLENVISDLREDVKKLSSTNNKNPIVFKDRNYLYQSLWIANSLKGAYLEARGVEFLNNALNKYGYQIIHTGNWKVKNGTKGISGQVKQGIGYLNTWLDIVEDAIITTLEDKKDISKILNNFTYSENIKLTLPDYEKIQKNIISGVSMKSGSKNIRFKNNVQPSEAIKVAGDLEDAIALHRLMMLVDLKGPYKSKRIHGVHEYYDSMFNYLLGKSLNKIVGETNKIMFSRNSVMTTKEFLLNRLNQGYMMGIYKKNGHINIRTDRGETVGLVKR